jgi:hypothetical protein
LKLHPALAELPAQAIGAAMQTFLAILALGAGATALLDLWGLARRPLLGQPRPDYAPIGRWIGHMARGTLRHHAIADAAPVRGERALGWIVHYLVGIALAALWLVVAPGWLDAPRAAPAIAYGLATVAAPWLLVQPALGAGIAAARSRDPWGARRQALLTHIVFGLGLWLAGCALHFVSAA